jgi:hypothetical protein
VGIDFRGRPEDEIRYLQHVWNDLIGGLADSARELERITGISVLQSGMSQSAVKGHFETMSQETGSFLLGQFTAIRVYAGNIFDLISNMFVDCSVITGYLVAIATNTANTVTQLKELRSDFKRARDEGF